MNRLILAALALLILLVMVAIGLGGFLVWRTAPDPIAAEPVPVEVVAEPASPRAKAKAKAKAEVLVQAPGGFVEQDLERQIREADGPLLLSALRVHLKQFDYQPFESGVNPFGANEDFRMYILLNRSEGDTAPTPRIILAVYKRRLVAVVHSRIFQASARTPIPLGGDLALTRVGRMKKAKRKALRVYFRYLVESTG